MPGILWLASYPKSGNTWMRSFLANLILGEADPLPLKRISEVCPSEPAEIWFRPLVKGKVSDLSPKELAALRVRAQERAVGLNENVIPMKTHSYLGEDCGQPIFSMKATFGAVYIIRDPRDVVVSAADHFGLALEAMIDKLADPLAVCAAMPGTIVHELQSSWSHHVESWTRWNHPGIFTVRYEDLLADPKERAEHVMLVDLARNDMSRNAENVHVEVFKEIQYYSHVIHLVSKVTGTLKNNASVIRMAADTFPAGTLSGAPKHMAMTLINRYEKGNRSFYGGAIGFIGFDGSFNHAIMIRTFLSHENKLIFQAGAGIVSKSKTESELQEVNNKLEALRKAVLMAEKI